MFKCNVNSCNNLFAINNEAQMLRFACIIIIISAELTLIVAERLANLIIDIRGKIIPQRLYSISFEPLNRF